MDIWVTGSSQLADTYLDLLRRFDTVSVQHGRHPADDERPARRTNREKRAPDLLIAANPPRETTDTLGDLGREPAGPTVLLPPPLGDSRENCRRFRQWLKRRKLTALVTNPVRFHPGFAKVKEILSTNILGEPRSIEIIRAPDAFAAWQLRLGDESTTHNSPINYYHDLALALWLLPQTTGRQFKESPAAPTATGKGLSLTWPEGERADVQLQEKAGQNTHVNVNVTADAGTLQYRETRNRPRQAEIVVTRIADGGEAAGRAMRHSVRLRDPLLLELGYVLQRRAAGHSFTRDSLDAAEEIVGTMDQCAT